MSWSEALWWLPTAAVILMTGLGAVAAAMQPARPARTFWLALLVFGGAVAIGACVWQQRAMHAALGGTAERLGAGDRAALSDASPRSRENSGAAPTDRLLTVDEVAELLNAKRAWVYRHQRALGGEKLDGLLRFSARRVHSYVERQRRAAA